MLVTESKAGVSMVVLRHFDRELDGLRSPRNINVLIEERSHKAASKKVMGGISVLNNKPVFGPPEPERPQLAPRFCNGLDGLDARWRALTR